MSTALSEADEIQAAVAGDSEAFGRLFSRHRQFVFRFIRAEYPHSPPDDLVQETFLNAFQFLNQFRGECAFSTWLITIAKRCIWMNFRDQERDDPYTDLEVENVSDGYSVNDYDVINAASKMPQRLQRVVNLQFEGYTEDEISEKLHQRKRSVQRDCKRARTQLQKLLKSKARFDCDLPGVRASYPPGG